MRLIMMASIMSVVPALIDISEQHGCFISPKTSGLQTSWWVIIDL